MYRFYLPVAVALTVILFTGVLLTQQDKPPQSSPVIAKSDPAKTVKTTAGVIISVNAKDKVFTIEANAKPVTFSWDLKTKITAAGHAVKPSVLVKGVRITVEYLSAHNQNYAVAIVITPPAPPKKN